MQFCRHTHDAGVSTIEDEEDEIEAMSSTSSNFNGITDVCAGHSLSQYLQCEITNSYASSPQVSCPQQSGKKMIR